MGDSRNDRYRRIVPTMELKRWKAVRASHILLYLFSFFVLAEWLRPLEVSTDTAYSYIFFIFIGVALALKYFQVEWYLSYPVKIGLILFFVHHIFYDGTFFSFMWVNEYVMDMLLSLTLLNGRDWLHLSPVFRTTLFFIMLWLLVYLIYFWVVQKYRVLFFLFLTFVYVGFLDTFTPYDATYAIVRLVVIGFFMLGFLSFHRLYAKENLKVERYAYFKWGLPLLFLISISVVVGILSPKWAPIWPDPVPYITKAVEEEEEEELDFSSVSKIGYGESDEKLGGPFVEDDTEVMVVESEDRQYWRVETKDVYTGKGWIDGQAGSPISVIGPNIGTYLSIVDDAIVEEERVATFEMSPFYRKMHFPYPVEPLMLESDEVELEELYFNESLENIEMLSRPMRYEVTYQKPVFEVEKLRAITNEGISAELLDRYTQLPDSLPTRVQELAQDIIGEEETLYDSVKAVERYFSENGYLYETKEVAVPGVEDDYVDQFLFETKKGYCDNFSTSMIVLLRSLDIPARWVKGYTQGEFLERVDQETSKYQITNNNAHSWVEVYFEGVGWVPFEPTRGFDNPAEFTYDLSNDEIEQPSTEEETEQQVNREEEDKEKSQTSFWVEIFGNIQRVMASVGIIVLLVIWTVWFTRKKWYHHWIVFQMKFYKGQEPFSKAYILLLKYLAFRGIKKKPEETLRQFAQRVDRSIGHSRLTTFTERYEQVLYGRGDSQKEWEDMMELWENLINDTSY